MKWAFDISPRDALAAPTSNSQTYTQSIVIVIVSILSALGAGWIMVSFVCFKSLRSFRHQLIMGLAISDCVMALNFLSSSAMNLGGRFIGAPQQHGFCSFNGFMTQVFVIQTDYWVLVIAICTYFILADHKRAASWVQDHRIVLASLPWVFSTIWASIGLGVAGYGNIGAWCWFTSDEVRLLVNFIPRWLIILTMLGMYARLYLVLFRAHRFLSSDAESSGRAASVSQSRTLDAAAHLSGSRSQHNNRAGGYGRGSQPPRASKKLKKLARLMLMYPIAYMLIWTLPTSIRIYQVATGRPAPFALQTVDKACIVIQGFVDAVIYGVNESSLASWRNLIFPQAFTTIDAVRSSPNPHGDKEKRPRMPSSRLSDMLTGDSASSFEDNLADNGSAVHIAGSTHRPDEAVELRHFGVSGGSFGITKTVEVDVVCGPPPPVYSSRARGSFFDQ